MVRFAERPEQFKARDAVNDHFKDTYITALSFASRAPAFLRALGLRPMPLGLDLRGGLYLLYQVDVNGAVAQLLDGYAQDARRGLVECQHPVQGRRPSSQSAADRPNAIRIVLPPEADVTAARTALSQGTAGRQHHDREPCPAAPPSSPR